MDHDEGHDIGYGGCNDHIGSLLGKAVRSL